MMRKMEKGKRAVIRVNGNVSDVFSHEDGGSQGSVSAPKRFNLAEREFFREVSDEVEGVKLRDGMEMKLAGFVDDEIRVLGKDGEEGVGRWLEDRVVYGQKWKKSYALKKDKVLVRGKGRLRKYEWKRKGAEDLVNTREVRVLGEVLTGVVGRSGKQVTETVEMMRRRVKDLRWMTTVEEGRTVDMIEGLFMSMVGSVAWARLVIVRLTKSERVQIEQAKAELGRWVLGVGDRASKREVYYELGWGTVWGKVVKAKLMFVWRLASMVDDEKVSRIFKIRKRQVDEGNRQGVVGEVREILERYDGKCARRIWAVVGKAGKNEFKRLVLEFVDVVEERMWLEWREQQGGRVNWYFLVKKKLGREGYVELDKRRRCLVAGVRLGVTSARGDKGNGGGECRLCGCAEETGVHWVASCSFFEHKRRGVLQGEGGGEGEREVWMRLMGMEVSKVVVLLEFIDSLLFLRLSVRLVDFVDEGRREDEILDDLNLRGDVWERVGPLFS